MNVEQVKEQIVEIQEAGNLKDFSSQVLDLLAEANESKDWLEILSSKKGLMVKQPQETPNPTAVKVDLPVPPQDPFTKAKVMIDELSKRYFEKQTIEYVKFEKLCENGYKNEQEKIIDYLNTKGLVTDEERRKKLDKIILVKEDKLDEAVKVLNTFCIVQT